MNLHDLLEQSEMFFTWAGQQPCLWEKVELLRERVRFYAGVSGSPACVQLRDSFHGLFDCADENGFPHVASLFYAQYVYYCRLLLDYYPFH